MILASVVVERSISVVAYIDTVKDSAMKFTEAQLEDSIIRLLGEQSYLHIHSDIEILWRDCFE